MSTSKVAPPTKSKAAATKPLVTQDQLSEWADGLSDVSHLIAISKRAILSTLAEQDELKFSPDEFYGLIVVMETSISKTQHVAAELSGLWRKLEGYEDMVSFQEETV